MCARFNTPRVTVPNQARSINPLPAKIILLNLRKVGASIRSWSFHCYKILTLRHKALWICSRIHERCIGSNGEEEKEGPIRFGSSLNNDSGKSRGDTFWTQTPRFVHKIHGDEGTSSSDIGTTVDARKVIIFSKAVVSSLIHSKTMDLDHSHFLPLQNNSQKFSTFLRKFAKIGALWEEIKC